MSEPKFTPGPWHWDNTYQSRDLSDTWSLIGRDGYGVLSCDGNCNSPQNCNSNDAHLIATAPEMYAFLESLEDATVEVDYEELDKLLKKARGEK